MADVYGKLVTWCDNEFEQAGADTSNSARVFARTEALQAIRKKLELDVICTGYDSPEVMETLRLVRDRS